MNSKFFLTIGIALVVIFGAISAFKGKSAQPSSTQPLSVIAEKVVESSSFVQSS